MGKVKRRKEVEKGGTEVTLLFCECAGGAGEGVHVMQVKVQVVQVKVQVVKKKEEGDFGGWRKEECIRRSLCGDEAVSH